MWFKEKIFFRKGMNLVPRKSLNIILPLGLTYVSLAYHTKQEHILYKDTYIVKVWEYRNLTLWLFYLRSGDQDGIWRGIFSFICSFFLFQSSPHPHLPSFLIERERERDLKCIWQIVKTYLTWWDFIWLLYHSLYILQQVLNV